MKHSLGAENDKKRPTDFLGTKLIYFHEETTGMTETNKRIYDSQQIQA